MYAEVLLLLAVAKWLLGACLVATETATVLNLVIVERLLPSWRTTSFVWHAGQDHVPEGAEYVARSEDAGELLGAVEMHGHTLLTDQVLASIHNMLAAKREPYRALDRLSVRPRDRRGWSTRNDHGALHLPQGRSRAGSAAWSRRRADVRQSSASECLARVARVDRGP